MGPRRAWRELRANAVRYLAVLVLIALGLTVVVALSSASLSGLDAVERGQRAGRLADGEFTTVAPLSAAQLAGLRRLADIEDASYLDLPATGPAPGRTPTLRVTALPAGLNRPVPDAGRAPEASGEVFVEKLHANAAGLRVGDPVVVGGRPLRIVGVGSLPHYAYPLADPGDAVGDPAAFGPAVVVPADFAALAAQRTRPVPTYAYRLTGATAAEFRSALLDVPVAADAVDNRVLADALRRAAAAGTPVDYPNLDAHLPAADNPRVTTARNDVEMNVQVAGVAGALVLLVVGYVLAAFSVDRLDREGSVIGALLACGFTPGELLRSYLVLPLGVTLAGSAAGTVAGALLAPTLTQVTELYYSLPAVSPLPPPAVVVVALAGPVAIVGAVNAVLLRGRLARPPLALLRPVPDAARASGVRLPRLRFATLFRIRQALRSLGGYGLIAAGVGLATLLLVFGLGMRDSVAAHVDRVGADVRYEHLYALRFPDLAAVPAGGQAATAVPLRVLDRGADAGEVTVLGLGPDDPFFPAEVARLGPHDLVVSDAVAHRYGLHAGSTLTAREAEGDLAWAFTVVEVVPHAGGLFAFTTRAHAQALLDPAVVAAAPLWSGPGAADPPPPGGYYNVLLSATPLDLDPDRVATHSTRAAALAGVASFDALMGPTIAMIVGPAIALFAIVLYVLIHAAIGRQRYAIALLKAFGYTEREVARLYLANYALVVAGTLAAALPLSLLVLEPLWRFMIAHIAMGAPFLVPVPTLAAIVALAAASYLVVRLVAGRDTRGVSVVEVLKFRE